MKFIIFTIAFIFSISENYSKSNDNELKSYDELSVKKTFIKKENPETKHIEIKSKKINQENLIESKITDNIKLIINDIKENPETKHIEIKSKKINQENLIKSIINEIKENRDTKHIEIKSKKIDEKNLIKLVNEIVNLKEINFKKITMFGYSKLPMYGRMYKIYYPEESTEKKIENIISEKLPNAEVSFKFQCLPW